MKPRPETKVLVGDCRERLRELPEASVHCCVTSPPYFNQRDYGSGSWEGGDPECDHTERVARGDGGRPTCSPRPCYDGKPNESLIQYRDICRKCGARRVDKQIGLERSPDCLGWATGSPCGECYVCTMVSVFREVRRVLRDDGTLWLNLGDKYSSGGRKDMGPQQGKQQTNRGSLGMSRADDGMGSKQLLGVPWRVALALQADGWTLRSDVIWCLSGSTKLYARTQKGEAPHPLKDLARLDPSTVELWNGERWTRVVRWMKSEETEGIEIVLRSGERVLCTKDHLWPTQRGNIRAGDLTTKDEFLAVRLPGPESDQADALDEEIAWMCGLFLAEGSYGKDSLSFAGHVREEEPRRQRLEAIARKYQGTVGSYSDKEGLGLSSSIVVRSPILKSIVQFYLRGRDAKTKSLTNRAWQRPDSFLRALLLGYLEGDGHYDAPNDRWRIGFTRNDRLADDLRTIAGRLGLPIRLVPGKSFAFGKWFLTYQGDLRLEPSEHHNARRPGQIVEIKRFTGHADFWDVEVEDEPHTFSLASGTLAHNCKPNAMPGSQGDRPTTNHEYLFLLAKRPSYYYDGEAIKERADTKPHNRGGVFRDQQVAGTMDWGGSSQYDAKEQERLWAADGSRTRRSVWTVPVASEKESHFAVFPERLILPCILAGTSERGVCPACGAPWRRLVETSREPTRPGKDSKVFVEGVDVSGASRDKRNRGTTGNRDPQRHVCESRTVGWEPGCSCDVGEPVPATVLDPFGGSGTTAAAALKKGRSAILVELNPEYAAIIERKLKRAKSRAGFML